MLLKVVLASVALIMGGLLPLTVGSAASGTWTATGSMTAARADAVAASLANGDVLVAGGGSCGAVLASAEIYHASGPAAGTWTSAGSLSVGRYMATATVLGDGKVLVAGGNTSACTPTASAEMYDPASNSWTVTGSMQFARSSFTATRVADQFVVVAGGFGNAGVSSTTEEYSEASGTWVRLANMNVGRQQHAAVALPRSGPAAVMVIGGNTGAGVTTSVETGEKLEGTVAFSWSQAPNMNVSRDDFTATLLSTMRFDGITVRNVVATHSDGMSMVARGLLLDNGGGALTVSKQVTVQNSSFVNVGPKDDGDCLVIQGSADVDANLLITNNSFDQCHKRAIKLQVGGVSVMANAINNPFSGNNAYLVRPETFDPVTHKPTFDMFSAIGVFSSNILLSGNTAAGVGSFYQGVEIDTIGGTPQNLSITRNAISNGAGSATGAPSSLIRSAVPVANLTIRSNKLTNAPFGVFLEQPVSGASIGCNTYTSVATPMANSNSTEQPCNPTPPSPQPPRQSLAIPSYFYPGATWGQLNAASPTVSLAVINPNSGPGTAVNFDYVNQVQQSRARGVTVLGYVATGYGNRPAVDIKRDIDAYYAWYDVDGIFFDEASTDCNFEPAYANLNAYVKGKGGVARTVLNPGTQTLECYMAAADIVVTFEGTSSSYLASYSSPSWVANYPPNRFWHLVYATPTDPQMQNVVALSKTRRAGWIYVTPDDVPNPWDTLPTDPYWSDELAAAQSTGAPTPTLASLTPTSAQIQPATGPGQPLTLTGTGFTGSSVVHWKRSTDVAPTVLPTTFVSATQLTATIPAGSLSLTGAAEVSVVTPAPGGGSSAPQPFFVTATAVSLAGPPVSQTSTSPTGTVSVSTSPSPPGTAGNLSASATGSGTLTLAQYTADPQTVTPAGGATNYFDVHLASGSSFPAVTVVDCNLTGPPANPAYGILLFWDGTIWTPVSNQTPSSPNAGCTTVSLSSTSTPSVTQLVGTEFAVVVDRTPPTVTYAGNSGTYGVLANVHVVCAAVDNTGGSGIASTTCTDVIAPAYSFTPGTNTFSATATDKAGNVGTGSFSFTLHVTPGDLCTLTTRFVQSSARYQSLPPQERAAVDRAAAALCQEVASAPNLTPAEKARVIAIYRAGVAALVQPGWLTQPQSATLIKLSAGL